MPIDYSKIPHNDVTDSYFYVNLPVDFFFDRENEKITPMMFDCLGWIWQHAGYRTGTTKMTSAGRILTDLWPRKKGRPSVRSVQRALRTLHNCGYITLPKRFRHDESYSIRANNYVVYVEDKKLALYPKVTIGYRELKAGNEEAYYDDSCDPVQTQLEQDTGMAGPEIGSSCGSLDARNGVPGRASSSNPTDGYSAMENRPVAPSDGDASNQCPSGVDALPELGRRSGDNTTCISSPSGKTGRTSTTSTTKQQLPAAAVVMSVSKEKEPKETEIDENDSKSLAQRYWNYLGKPEKFNPTSWVKPFSELMTLYPNLEELLWYTFEKDQKGKFRTNLLKATYPVPYLKSVLEDQSSCPFDAGNSQRKDVGPERRPAPAGDDVRPDNKKQKLGRTKAVKRNGYSMYLDPDSGAYYTIYAST